MNLGVSLAPGLADRLSRQLDEWRENLVALDGRQRLLYFKHTASSSFEVVAPSPAAVAERLHRAGVTFFTRASADDAAPVGSPANSLEVGDKTDTELQRGLRRLDQVSQQTFVDKGLWTLYLGLGMLQWVDPAEGKTVVSPLVLLPVELSRAGQEQPYELRRNQIEPVFNPALRLKLDSFALQPPDLDTDDVDVAAVMRSLETTVSGRDGWRVLDRAVLTTFSFHKEAMYQDLLNNHAAVLEHPIVQLLALGPDSPTADTLSFDLVDEQTLDETYPPEQLMSILDADATQRRCILAAKAGQSFVMDGPPGTGKSQTIANMIAELMADGQTVLFVSQKAAALDVVRNRLAKAHLDHFLLELHSHTATRKHVIDTLYTALSTQARVARGFTDTDSLAATRQQLTQYAIAINETRKPLGRSLFQVLGRLAQLHAPVEVSLPRSPQWADLSSATWGEVVDHAKRLAACWRPVVEGEDFLWRGLATTDHDNADIRRIATATARAADAARALTQRLGAVDDDLGLRLSMSEPDARRRLALAELAEHHPGSPVSWLTASQLDDVRSLATARETEMASLFAVRAALQDQAGARWQELDAERLSAWLSLPSSLWRPAPSYPLSKGGRLVAFLTAAPPRLFAMAEDAAKIAALLGMPDSQITVARAATYAQLAGLGAATTRPEAAWLNPTVQNAVRESLRVLGPVVDLVRQHEQTMRDAFTDGVLALDLSALHVRFRDTHRGLRRFSGQARADKKLLKSVIKTGKLDKHVLARLEDAVAWQAAHQDLSRQEDRFAAPLGASYQRCDTDFARVASAVEVAHKAVRLAGADLDSARLATQLAAGSIPDASLTLLAQRLSTALTQWDNDVSDMLDNDAGVQHAALDVRSMAAWCERHATELTGPLKDLDHVTTVLDRDVTLGQAQALLTSAREIQASEATLVATRTADEHLLGSLYRGEATNWSALTEALSWAQRVRTTLSGPLTPSVAANLSSLTLTSEHVGARIGEWERARDSVAAFFQPTRAHQLSAELGTDLDGAAGLLTEMAATSTHDIDEWGLLEQERQWLSACGLGPVIDAAHTARIDATCVPDTVEHALLQAWADETVRIDDRLQRYRAAQRDGLVQDFQTLDRALVSDSHARVAERCAARRPKSLRSHSAQVITREAQKKTRHKPIRELLSQTAELVQELKPCFMMSPLSVSQYLPGEMRFDVVIFDEASQVLPSDAVNCVYRGKQLVVAGDQKQLPPTAFFASADDDPDSQDTDLDSFESVLDLAKGAGGLTSLPLRWHYRSQHEALITYSNYRFYQGQLYTFPGAVFDAPDLGLELIEVKGQYRRGGSRDNPIEAAKVAERVAHHLHDNPTLSIGVVTFSGAQEDAVRDALAHLAQVDTQLFERLADRDRLDGFFVKNLEDVQGDERDIIVFSIGYGPDEFNKLTMNFGPLNRDGGWRRLNVAITRARRRVEVVSSFRANRMTETPSEGVRHLRGYLDFAERGLPALAQSTEGSLGDAESPFEEDVLQVIQSWGYDVVPQVGAAGYRIDMAVRHPDRPGQYVLAVECDGAAYHSAKTARDRDRLREAVLVGLGWTVHRIWGISWWRDRDTQLNRLRAAIQDAITANDDPSPTPPRPDLEPIVEFDTVDFDAVPDWCVPYYAATDISPVIVTDPKTPEALPALRRYFEKVLTIEAPIHDSLLMQRFAKTWNVRRLGPLIRENVDIALSRAQINGANVTKDNTGFYRKPSASLRAVRIPTDKENARTVAQVPPEELELAVQYLIKDAVLTDRAQAIQGVARLFGWRRTGPDIQNAIDAALSRLIDSGAVEKIRGGGLRVGTGTE